MDFGRRLWSRRERCGGNVPGNGSCGGADGWWSACGCQLRVLPDGGDLASARHGLATARAGEGARLSVGSGIGWRSAEVDGLAAQGGDFEARLPGGWMAKPKVEDQVSVP